MVCQQGFPLQILSNSYFLHINPLLLSQLLISPQNKENKVHYQIGNQQQKDYQWHQNINSAYFCLLGFCHLVKYHESQDCKGDSSSENKSDIIRPCFVRSSKQDKYESKTHDGNNNQQAVLRNCLDSQNKRNNNKLWENNHGVHFAYPATCVNGYTSDLSVLIEFWLELHKLRFLVVEQKSCTDRNDWCHCSYYQRKRILKFQSLNIDHKGYHNVEAVEEH